MTDTQERLILVQKQLSIAMKALKEIDYEGNWRRAAMALEEIEHIRIMKEGRHD